MTNCVLLVEDNLLHRKLYAALLVQEGFTPVPLTSLKGAVLAAHRANAVAAIVDILLPQIDGRDIIRQLRADPQTKSMPIMAISASSAPDIAATCLAAGANKFRSKPWPITTFQRDMRKLVGQ